MIGPPSVPGMAVVPATACATDESDAVPLTWTVSSTGPSWVRAKSRIDAFSEVPVRSEATMIAVPSNEPISTSTASPRRRLALRNASRRSIGRRSAS